MYVYSCNALSARFFAVDRAQNSYSMIMIYAVCLVTYSGSGTLMLICQGYVGAVFTINRHKTVFLRCCRLEIEAEPWMEGVLDTLMGIYAPAAATSVTEDNTVSAESHFTSTPATVTAEQPASDYIVTAVQENEPTRTSDLNNDIGNVQKTTENASSHVTSAELHSDDAKNAGNMDLSSQSSDLYTSPPEPQSNVPLSNTNVIPQSLVNSDAVMEKEDVDAGVIMEESLTHSLPSLSAVPLTIPLCPPRYLKLSFLPDEKLVRRFLHLYRSSVWHLLF